MPGTDTNESALIVPSKLPTVKGLLWSSQRLVRILKYFKRPQTFGSGHRFFYAISILGSLPMESWRRKRTNAQILKSGDIGSISYILMTGWWSQESLAQPVLLWMALSALSIMLRTWQIYKYYLVYYINMAIIYMIYWFRR